MPNGLDGVRPWWRDKKDGCVYLVEAANGYYKIGKSTGNLQKRFSTLVGFSPVTLVLRHSIPCVDCHTAERKLHLRFQSKRLHGEWFALSVEDVEWIKATTEKEL